MKRGIATGPDQEDITVDLTPEEITKRQAEEAQAVIANEIDPVNVIKQLEDIFENQPVTVRAAFYGYRPAIKEAILNNDYEAAGFIINSVVVPEGLESVKDDMLGVLKVVVEKQDLPDEFEASEQATPTTDASDWWTKLWQSVQAFFGGNNG